MSKPINVEAQRVHKVIADSYNKLKVLSLLNADFFEELKKKDDQEVIDHFGPIVGKHLLRQAYLEEKFQTVCVDDGVNMTPLESELCTPEARQCALNVKENITKLVRLFSLPENQLKLKPYETRSGEMSVFIDQFGQLQKLFTTKLNTPMEEKKAQEKSRKVLVEKCDKLQDIRDQKKETYDKQCEDCSKSKELRDAQKKILKEEVSEENVNRERQIGESEKNGIKNKEALKEAHNKNIADLDTQIVKYDKELTKMMDTNKKQEEVLRKSYKTAHFEFQANMEAYDHELKQQTKGNKIASEEYDGTLTDLNNMKDSLAMLQEEKRKRDEIAAIMKAKNDEQQAIMDKMIRASEFIQAHWRGMQERRLMEKSMKGKKKKRGKKGKK